MTQSDIQSLKLIFKLYKQITTLQVVKTFLKNKGVHYSASGWDELWERRVLPAFEDGKIKISEFEELLKEAEEHGKQHIFMYKCSPEKAKDLMNPERVKGILAEHGLTPLLDQAKLLNEPDEPTIVDIRYESSGPKSSLVIKLLETRISNKKLGEEDTGDGYFIVKYHRIKERTVNLVKLHDDGLLEMRVMSISNSGNYNRSVADFWRRLAFILHESHFSMTSLAKAKNYLWENREDLGELIRHSSYTFRNDIGNSIMASSGKPDSSLLEDEGVQSGIKSFVDHEGYCDENNIYFLANEDNKPSTNIHVLLSGLGHEFAITKHCLRDDYEFVLNKIRSFNQ